MHRRVNYPGIKKLSVCKLCLFVRPCLRDGAFYFIKEFSIFDCVNKNVLTYFYNASKIYRLEVTYKYGLGQLSKDSMDFIKHYSKRADLDFTDLGESMLQIIAWDEDNIPQGIFRESSLVEYNEHSQPSLQAFFRNILIYHKYKLVSNEH